MIFGKGQACCHARRVCCADRVDLHGLLVPLRWDDGGVCFASLIDGDGEACMDDSGGCRPAQDVVVGMGPDGSTRVRLRSGPADERIAAISSDGRRVAFSVGPVLYRVDVQTRYVMKWRKCWTNVIDIAWR